MKTLKEIEKILKKNKNKIFKEFEVEEIGIFGSYVRGEATVNSDLDVLISLKENHHVGLIEFMRLSNFLEDITNVKIDLVTKSGIKRALRPYILSEVKYL